MPVLKCAALLLWLIFLSFKNIFFKVILISEENLKFCPYFHFLIAVLAVIKL